MRGKLEKNERGNFELNGLEVRSGTPMWLLIEGYWIEGNVDRWNDSNYWFSRRDGVPVLLYPGLFVMVSESECAGVSSV